MAAYLLLHGAWHGAWCWEPLGERLARAGHEVVAPDLPGLSPTTWNAAGRFGLADHIAAAVTALGRIAQHEVILVAHSYAGMLARALESLRPDRLGHICCIEALHPEPGTAVLDLLPDAGKSFQDSVRETPNGPVLPPPDVSRFVIPDADMAKNIAARLLPQPFRTFSEPLPHSVLNVSRSIPRTYVFARDRNPNPYQRFIDQFRSEATCRVVGMTGGHELMLTRPSEVAELLLEIATRRNARNPKLICN